MRGVRAKQLAGRRLAIAERRERLDGQNYEVIVMGNRKATLVRKPNSASKAYKFAKRAAHDN